MEKGLTIPLSLNEEATLRSVQTTMKLAGLDHSHIERLASLGLVSVTGKSVSLTFLGRRRIEDRLPPERAAAQKRREAEFLSLLGQSANTLDLLDKSSLKLDPAPEAEPKARTRGKSVSTSAVPPSSGRSR